MKTTTLPPLRVNPKVRREIESILDDGETLSSFMLEAITHKAAVRREQRAFINSAIGRAQQARRTGKYVEGEAVFKRLEGILVPAKKRARTR